MAKFTIYQLLPRHFGNKNRTRKHNGTITENGCGKLNDFTLKALTEIKNLGITHVWFTGILEHATQTDYSQYNIKTDNKAIVKGIAGSPYAVKDYYDIDPDLAVSVPDRMREFENLINRTHKAGLKAIIDFIPNHVARQYQSDAKPQGISDLGENDNPSWAFSPLNNFYYLPGQKFLPQFDVQDYEEYPAKATGNDQFTASPGINDWYETIKLNYGVNYTEGGQKQFEPIPDTWLKMFGILHFWASKKIDGFRCDMAEMVPVEFWGWVIPKLKSDFPEIIFIAEVYNPNEYRNYIFNGKFDYLYDKVGLYDKLRSILTENHAASDITHCWQALNGIENNMLHFLENHDEQRIASDFFCANAIQAIPAMVATATLNKAPVMVYSGQELGEKGMDYEGFSGTDGRTSIFDYWCVESIKNWVNGGKFGESKLTNEQKTIRSFYNNLLNITLNEKAISQGDFFDLEYANFENNHFNTHRQYAYFRKFENDLLLVVLNFDTVNVDIKLKIPVVAFDYLSINNGITYHVTDLLSKNKIKNKTILSSDVPFTTQVQANAACIFKIEL